MCCVYGTCVYAYVEYSPIVRKSIVRRSCILPLASCGHVHLEVADAVGRRCRPLALPWRARESRVGEAPLGELRLLRAASARVHMCCMFTRPYYASVFRNLFFEHTARLPRPPAFSPSCPHCLAVNMGRGIRA